jgi:hypothetical protein
MSSSSDGWDIDDGRFEGPIERLLRLGRCLSDERAIRIVALLRVVQRAEEHELRHALILSTYQMRPALAKLMAASVIVLEGEGAEVQYRLEPGGSHLWDELLHEHGLEEEWAWTVGHAVERLGELRCRPTGRSTKPHAA